MKGGRFGLCVKGKKVKVFDLYDYGYSVSVEGWKILCRDNDKIDLDLSLPFARKQLKKGIPLTREMFDA